MGGDLSSALNGGGKTWKMGWMTACLIILVVVTGWCAGEETASTYMDNFCYCDLDKHLVDVRKALIQGEDPPTAPAAEATTPAPSNETSSSNSPSDSSSSDNSATTGGDSDSSSSGSSDDSSSDTASDTSSSSGTSSDTGSSSNADSSSDTSSSSDTGSSSDTSSSSDTGSSDTTSSSDTGSSSDTTSSTDTGSSSDADSSSDTSSSSDNGSGTATTSSASDNSASGGSSSDESSDTTTSSSSDSTTSGSAAGSDDSSVTTASTSTGTADGSTTVSSDTNSTDTTSSNDGNGGNNGNGNNARSEDSTTEATTQSTTASVGRRKRAADALYYDYQDDDNDALMAIMETPHEAYIAPRMKRETLDMGSALMSQKDPLFSFITQRVEYSGLKTASDQGVMYDKQGNANNCSCEEGSTVAVKLCLLNLPYDTDLAKANSDMHKKVSNELLFPLTGVLFKGLVGEGGVRLFRRVAIQSYEKRDEESTNAVMEVSLSSRVYQAEYHVKNAIEPAIRSGEIGPYTTDHELCLVTEDKTPPEPVVRSPVWWLRFLCLPLGIAVLAALVVFTCIGKRDAYYVRFW